MSFPAKLAPNGSLTLTLPSSRSVEVPKTTPTFPVWDGAVPDDTYGGKSVLDADGEAAFAELFILRLFEKNGWEGVWIDTFGGTTYHKRYWQDEVVTVPRGAQEVLKVIGERNGGMGGCFDVFAWRGEDVFFAEAKQKGADSIRDTQKEWLDYALDTGLPLDSFLIVEWTKEASG